MLLSEEETEAYFIDQVPTIISAHLISFSHSSNPRPNTVQSPLSQLSTQNRSLLMAAAWLKHKFLRTWLGGGGFPARDPVGPWLCTHSWSDQCTDTMPSSLMTDGPVGLNSNYSNQTLLSCGWLGAAVSSAFFMLPRVHRAAHLHTE